MRSFRLSVALVLVVQCAVILYWAARKTNMFEDELYSYECAQNLLKGEDRGSYFTGMDSWRHERWIPAEPFKKCFALDEDESVLSLPFGEAVSGFFTGRNYMWILNILESVFSPGKMSRWPAFWFNIVIFILTQLLLCFLLRSMSVDRWKTVLALLMYGLCPLTVSSVIFVRFYVWTIFLCLCAVFLHWVMWKADNVPLHLCCEAVFLICLYLGFKNTEQVCVFGGALVVFFSIGLILRKRYRQFLYYSVPVVALGLLYLGLCTDVLSIILHPGSNTSVEGIVGSSSRAFESLTVYSLARRVLDLLYSFGSNGFGSGYIAVALALVLLAAVGSFRKGKSGPELGFAVIMVLISVVFFLFLILTDLIFDRYMTFPLLALTVALWTVIQRMEAFDSRKLLKLLLVGLVAAVCVLPFFKRNINYVYEEDKPLVSALKDYSDLDIVLTHIYQEAQEYECVYWCGDDISLYPVRSGKPSHPILDCPERFLFWGGLGFDNGTMMETIENQGYNMTLLGQTHISVVYLCEVVEDF